MIKREDAYLATLTMTYNNNGKKDSSTLVLPLMPLADEEFAKISHVSPQELAMFKIITTVEIKGINPRTILEDILITDATSSIKYHGKEALNVESKEECEELIKSICNNEIALVWLWRLMTAYLKQEIKEREYSKEDKDKMYQGIEDRITVLEVFCEAFLESLVA